MVYIPGPELFWNFREAILYGRLYLLGGPGTFCIVGKGGHTLPFLGQPPFSKISPFPEIQDVPIFYRPIRKTKVLNDTFNRFVYKFYLQSILILEEYLLKR